MCISGGLRFIYIKDEAGNLIYEEPSLGPESVRPVFLINGNESIDRVFKIMKAIDVEAHANQLVGLKFKGAHIALDIHYEPSLDGKLVRVYVTAQCGNLLIFL